MLITLLYIIIGIIIILFFININIYIYCRRISILEKNISILFDKRLGVIPGFFEISKKNIIKHSHVFHESLKIFKLDSTIYDSDIAFSSRLYTMSILDHELEFLFRIFNRNSSLISKYKYLYLKNITIDNGIEIGISMKKYKKYIKIYNFLININNILGIGYVIPFNPLKNI